MKVASLQFNPICENTYVVWDDTNECIVVDAGNSDERENARLKEFIDSRGLHPRMAVNTHGHFDHTLGVQFLKDTYGIPFALSGKDKFLLDNAAPGSSIFGVKVGAMPSIDLDLDTTDEVRFGHTALKIIPTPGHTPGHVSLYAPQATAVFTGDTLFRESIGRTDLPGGTTRGSCVRSSNGSSRWATKRKSTPDTANRPRSATRASTTPSSWRCSTGR